MNDTMGAAGELRAYGLTGLFEYGARRDLPVHSSSSVTAALIGPRTMAACVSLTRCRRLGRTL